MILSVVVSPWDRTELGIDSQDNIIDRIARKVADREDDKSDGEDAGIAVLAASSQAIQPKYTNGQLDDFIDRAFKLGYPLWHNAKTGCYYPSRPTHNFQTDNLVEGARIDFFRGEAKDDYPNAVWAQWLEHLPMYKARVVKSHGISGKSTNSIGNALEIVAGLAFTARCRGYNLDKHDPLPSSWVCWKSEESRQAWCLVFEAMKSLDLPVPVEEQDVKIKAVDDAVARRMKPLTTAFRALKRSRRADNTMALPQVREPVERHDPEIKAAEAVERRQRPLRMALQRLGLSCFDAIMELPGFCETFAPSVSDQST